MASEAAEAELWQRFRERTDEDARDRLVLLHMPWAAAIARNVHRRVPAYAVDRDDFVQNATIGLIEAISRFEPQRGVAFRSFATPRIRGAVFNGLRAIIGERPTAAADRQQARLEALREGGAGGAFEQVINAVVGLGLGYMLDDAAQTLGDGCGGAGSAYEYARLGQARARLLKAVDALPPRLRLIVKAHYFQHVPFIDLAQRFGLSKGRVSQLHHEALSRLRGLMGEH